MTHLPLPRYKMFTKSLTQSTLSHPQIGVEFLNDLSLPSLSPLLLNIPTFTLQSYATFLSLLREDPYFSNLKGVVKKKKKGGSFDGEWVGA